MTFGTAGSRFCLACLLIAGVLGTEADGQSTARAIQGVDVQKLANGILGVMSYTVAPDVTTSTLTITNGATSNPGLSMTQLGGGFTWRKSTPLYLEGNAAYALYGPTFLVSDGTETRPVPVKWNSVSATAGVGWDFPISEDGACGRSSTSRSARSRATLPGSSGGWTTTPLRICHSSMARS